MKKPPPKTNEEKLDIIVECLQKMNHRDRMRTIAGFFSGLIRLLPIIVFLWSAWYFYENGWDIITRITNETAKQAAEMTKEKVTSINTAEFFEQFNDYAPQR